MFLRCHSRKKNGKPHRYWSVVESRRLAGGNPAQRQVLYLGEINDHQEAAWRKTIAVFDEQKNQSCEVSLFPSDRIIPPDQANALSVVLSEMRLVRPRSFGDCWLGCRLWEELGLQNFWREKLGGERGGVAGGDHFVNEPPHADVGRHHGGGAFGGVVDACLHPLEPIEPPFDPGGACAAGHATDDEGYFCGFPCQPGADSRGHFTGLIEHAMAHRLAGEQG